MKKGRRLCNCLTRQQVSVPSTAGAYKFLIILTSLNCSQAAQYPQGGTLSFSALTRQTELFQVA